MKLETSSHAEHGAGGLSINSRAFCSFQFAAVTLLIVFAVLRYVFGIMQGNATIEQATRMFDLDRENSIPTWFSMMNLLLSSVLAFVIYNHCRPAKGRDCHYWLMLGILFLGLSAEEVIGIHERITHFHNLRGSDIKLISLNAWVVYGAVFAASTALYFVPFLLRLERRMALMILLSGGIFLSGALLSEFLQTLMWDNHPRMWSDGETLPPARPSDFLVFLEEAGEMYGVALFNSTLFAIIHRLGATLTIRPVANRSQPN